MKGIWKATVTCEGLEHGSNRGDRFGNAAKSTITFDSLQQPNTLTENTTVWIDSLTPQVRAHWSQQSQIVCAFSLFRCAFVSFIK